MKPKLYHTRNKQTREKLVKRDRRREDNAGKGGWVIAVFRCRNTALCDRRRERINTDEGREEKEKSQLERRRNSEEEGGDESRGGKHS